MSELYHIHHIVPKHMGGTDDPSNLIKLTVEEHAQAHFELYEKHGKAEDLIAYKALTKQIDGEEARIMAVKAANTGKVLSEEHKRKIGDAHRGKVYNEETRKKMSESHKGQKPVVTDQMREKLRVANTGKVHSDERKAKIAEGMRKAHERRKQQRQLGDRGSE